MSLAMNWVGNESIDAIAQVRMRCYASAPREIERFIEGLKTDGRAKPGDWLIASRDGQSVGTSTSLSMKLWIRGGCVPCQGVAYVGTVKTQRRAGAGGERGVASQLMHETLRKGRERGDVVSALMPFRASYYEHFGYGLAEQRTEWTVPLAILPQGDFAGMRFCEPGDIDAVSSARQRVCEQGQCDIETSAASWINRRRQTNEGWEFIDRPDANGPVRSYLYATESKDATRTMLRIVDHGAASHVALMKQLHFLASLKDQYSQVMITLRSDLQLNLLLRETQIPHRLVDHPVATARPYTRMQIRVLDHKRLLESMTFPQTAGGALTMLIHELDGEKKFRIELSAGRASVSTTESSADAECSEVIWGSIVSGNLRASEAARIGKLTSTDPSSLAILDRFSAGPAPFCGEYF